MYASSKHYQVTFTILLSYEESLPYQEYKPNEY